MHGTTSLCGTKLSATSWLTTLWLVIPRLVIPRLVMPFLILPVLTLSVLIWPALGGAAEPGDRAQPPELAATEGATATAKPTIGRIFFSPAERHHRRADALDAPPGTRTSNDLATDGRRVVNGALSSNSRGRVVWINGAPVEESTAGRSVWTDRNGNIWLSNGTQGTRLLRAGQSLGRDGTIEDLLPHGSITRR